MANQSKPKATKTKETEKPSIEEELEILDAPKAVDRVFVHPETEEERTYVQHEMGFGTKLKFFRLLSGTVRLATNDGQGGITEFVEETLGGSAVPDDNSTFITSIMKLVELVPDFYEEAVMLILKVPLDEQQWVSEALEDIDDDTGIDILDVFISQNGQALRNFFTKHLQKLQKRAEKEFGSLAGDTEQE